ncbi:MAG: hypothetical protein HZB16_11670 [Armatimonadetes bacterium]|nr:hypothetical protein [Armatimonadota bacterium]
MWRWLSLAVAVVTCTWGAEIVWDFETGDMQGWKVTEGSFGALLARPERYRNTGQPYVAKQGTWFLSTLETPQQTCSDVYTGVIESPVVRLEAGAVRLMVGGGSHADTAAQLCDVSGKALLTAHGINDEALQRVTWDATPWVGQLVYLRLIDGQNGGWGHVTIDDVHLSGTIDADATAKLRASHKRVLGADSRLGAGTPASLKAAIEGLRTAYGPRYPNAAALLAKVQALGADPDPEALAALRREALAAHPELAHPLVFVSRAQYRPDHHNTETMFQTNEINTGSFVGGGSLRLLDVASDQSRVLVDAPTGIARDPEVHFDGQRVLFSMRRDIKDDYHIYEVGADGQGLRQLTRLPGVSDIDPLYLPTDQILFSGTREPKYCMCNRHIMANLCLMEPDGANITQIGRNTLFEGHGALLPDGRVLYDRWEYVDRNFGDGQGLWTANPDGTNHVVYWGNNTSSPGGVIDARPMPGRPGQPGGETVVCTFTSCHDRPWGAIAIVDRRQAIDGKRGVVRTWPAGAIDRVDQGGFDSYTGLRPKYEDPYPLDDQFILCSRMTGEGEQMGIYVLDTWGNETLLHIEGAGCFDPMPLRSRPRPPAIPVRREWGDGDGLFYVDDVYDGTHMAGVKRGEVKTLRVVESPEKRFWASQAWGGQGIAAPAMDWHDFNNKRILGTVPVEPDGSAYFSVPSGKFVYFQLLDERGRMVQSMRSGTLVQPGERAGCVGCHDNRLGAPKAKRAAAKSPATLREWHGPTREFGFRAEVQPVFDRQCLPCHDWGGAGAKAVVLAGDRDLTFNAAYNELWRKGLVKVAGAGPHQNLPAKSWGSHASRLVKAIESDHYGVKLDAESYDRIVTWVDLNAPYYPSYASAYPDNLAGRCPLPNDRVNRLGELTGLRFFDLAGFGSNRGPQISFDRPEMSPALVALRERDAAGYAEALGIVRAGRDQLAKKPECDAEGFQMCEVDQRREAKYERLAQMDRRARAARQNGTKVYDAAE